MISTANLTSLKLAISDSTTRRLRVVLSEMRELPESFRYQNTMSHSTTQERVATTLELRDTEREHQQRIEASLRQVEQLRLQQEEARKLELVLLKD